jgi:Sec-independent protein secretion pathway component TatC
LKRKRKIFKLPLNKLLESVHSKNEPIWKEPSFVKPVIPGKAYWSLLILIIKYLIILASPFILYELYRYIRPKIPGIFSSIKRKINALMVRCRMKK